jgi:hypothetical protein
MRNVLLLTLVVLVGVATSACSISPETRSWIERPIENTIEFGILKDPRGRRHRHTRDPEELRRGATSDRRYDHPKRTGAAATDNKRYYYDSQGYRHEYR